MSHIRADKSLCEGRFFQDPVTNHVRCSVCQESYKPAQQPPAPKGLVASVPNLDKMLKKKRAVSSDPAVTHQLEGTLGGISEVIAAETARRGGEPLKPTNPPPPHVIPNTQVPMTAAVPAPPVTPNVPVSGKGLVEAAAKFDATAPPVDPATVNLGAIPKAEPTPGASASPLLAAMAKGSALGEQSKAESKKGR